jgi:hypothetical protein
MPVLLKHQEIDRWLHGTIQDVIGIQFGEPFDADRMQLMTVPITASLLAGGGSRLIARRLTARPFRCSSR